MVVVDGKLSAGRAAAATSTGRCTWSAPLRGLLAASLSGSDRRGGLLVSAWASEQGLVLGQCAVDGKSNAITAIPELLDTLRLEGCIVTLDAMGCQKEIAERIRAKGADYLLVLKANHDHAFKAVREHFERTCFGLGSGGRCSTPSAKATAAWSAGASSWTRRPRILSP